VSKSKVRKNADGTSYLQQYIYFCALAGIAATSAFKLVKTHGSLQKVIDSLDKAKHPVPEACDYGEVRELFVNPHVADPATLDLKWVDPDEAGILKFLVEEKGFNAARVESGIAKLKKARTSGSQMRMDSFFKTVASPPTAAPVAGAKRKVRSQLICLAGAFTTDPQLQCLQLDDKSKAAAGAGKSKKR
jgi:flap endonuclease-1